MLLQNYNNIKGITARTGEPGAFSGGVGGQEVGTAVGRVDGGPGPAGHLPGDQAEARNPAAYDMVS